MTRMASFLVLVVIILGIGFLFYKVMIGFLLPLFLASLLVVMFRPLHRWYLEKCQGRPRVAAGLTTATVMLIVLVPAAIVGTLAVGEASSIVVQLDDAELTTKVTELRESLGLQMPFGEHLHYVHASFVGLTEDAASGATSRADPRDLQRLEAALADFQETLLNESYTDQAAQIESVRQHVVEAQSRLGSVLYQDHIQKAAVEFAAFKVNLLGNEYKAWIIELVNPTPEELDRLKRQIFSGAPNWVRTIGSATGGLVVQVGFGLFIMIIALHFFLADGPAMLSSLMRLSPLDDRHERELLEEFDRVSRAVVVATLLSAVVQGILAGLGFWVAGVGSVFLLTLLTTLFALVPFVGAAAVWVPACLYLFFFEERLLAAGLLAAYGGGIVSLADNVIKPMVLHGQSNLHPLLALLSVLGGVQALGPIGVLVGPMVVVFLQTLLNILQRELTSLEQFSPASQQSTGASGSIHADHPQKQDSSGPD